MLTREQKRMRRAGLALRAGVRILRDAEGSKHDAEAARAARVLAESALDRIVEVLPEECESDLLDL